MILNLNCFYSIFAKKHNSHSHFRYIKNIKLFLGIVVLVLSLCVNPIFLNYFLSIFHCGNWKKSEELYVYINFLSYLISFLTDMHHTNSRPQLVHPFSDTKGPEHFVHGCLAPHPHSWNCYLKN